MIIQLKGVGEINKGAYLMFLSIIQYFKENHPNKDLTFVVHLGHKFSPELAEKYDIKPLVKTKRKGIELRSLAKLIPFSVRKKMNFYIENDLDIILDASGFLYGDQWPVSSIKGTLSNDIKRIRSNGTKVILMPQAFGSFENAAVKREVRKVIDHVNLGFARDQTSFNYLLDAYGKKDNIFLAPDFTNILKHSGNVGGDAKDSQVLIIPNIKLLEQTKLKKETLINFFREIIEEIQLNDYSPSFLIHEGIKDENLAKDINKVLTNELPIIIEPDALKQKAIIGNSYAVITGRFHGLVSSLSQGVPSIGLSWSHKYEMLLNDYNQKEFLIDFENNNSKLLINKILDKQNNKRIRTELEEKAKTEKERTFDMWSKVESMIFNNA